MTSRTSIGAAPSRHSIGSTEAFGGAHSIAGGRASLGSSTGILPSGTTNAINNTNPRNSLMEPTLTMQSGQNSIGHHRMSLLPSVPSGQASMQPTMPPLPVPEFDSEELTARMQIFTNELNSCIQRIKSRIADGTEQWVQETSELQAMDRSLREELKVAQVQEQAVVKGKPSDPLMCHPFFPRPVEFHA